MQRNLSLTIAFLALTISATGCQTLRTKKDSTPVVAQTSHEAGPERTEDATKGDSVKEEKDSTFSVYDWVPFMPKEEEPEPYPTPVKMVVAWTPDIMMRGGHTPTRGFGARMFFYNKESKPIPVDGTIEIHAYEAPRTGEQPKKITPYRFQREKLVKHFSQGDFGASYSLWIPVDAATGDRKKMVLVPSFINHDGKRITSAPSTLMLPGRVAQDDIMRSQRSIRLSGPTQENLLSRANINGPSGLSTTTIHRGGAPVPSSRKMVDASTLRKRASELLSQQRQSVSKRVVVPAAHTDR
ncbi:MAG: hypothetical protein AAFP90_12625 [Planctomycetota bacterium]